ncbi:transcription factor HHO3-like [Primulina huaijiensis]|uniref:transcription factor HHO3-like n=1 Tax=Primulina huaijiensis TaxID=1492673 RepID=UPI003CC7996E
MERSQDYIQALEEERHKIQDLGLELPLCFELVTKEIESCKHQLSLTTTECNLRGQSECSEQTSCPVFEEFIPLKRASSQSDGEEQESQKPNKDLADMSNTDGKNDNEKNSEKSDWLRSAQLWNHTRDPSSKEHSPRKVVVTEVTRNGGGRRDGAFQPFKKEKSLGTSGTSTAPRQVPKNKSPSPASTSSTAGTGGGDKKEENEGGSLRKAKRFWSPDLHTRFVQSLHQLGGSLVATPKQIRELMKVDGLTNDEVKSHLQKYRLHMRSRVCVPPEHAIMATTTTSRDATPSTRIYAPIASVARPFREAFASAAPQRRRPQSDAGGSHSGEGGVDGSHSPATSSSTTTTSPSY